MKFIKISEYYADIGQCIDCFFSFFILNNTLYSVHRKHRLFSYQHWPASHKENLSQIILTEYSDKNPEKIQSKMYLLDGNDPRVVADQNRAYILSEGALHSKTRHTLTILPEKINIDLSLAEDLPDGKNWQPFIHNQAIYIADSISPFRVNKIDIETGLITRENQTLIDFNLTAEHDNYSLLRGGSNALYDHQGVLRGWGHATVKPYEHIPFLWKYAQSSATVSFINVHTAFKNKGYSIVDPTCFFEWDDEHYAIGFSCSQRDWFHPQWFLNALLITEKKDILNERLSPFTVESIRKPIIFHAWELDSLIEFVYKDGGIYNNNQGGCLLCGPSHEIALGKEWHVEFCYSSADTPNTLVGDFDILLNIDGVEQLAASTQIYGTNGHSTRIQLRFDSANSTSKKALIQTRAFAVDGASLTGYFFELNHEQPAKPSLQCG